MIHTPSVLNLAEPAAGVNAEVVGHERVLRLRVAHFVHPAPAGHAVDFAGPVRARLEQYLSSSLRNYGEIAHKLRRIAQQISRWSKRVHKIDEHLEGTVK